MILWKIIPLILQSALPGILYPSITVLPGWHVSRIWASPVCKAVEMLMISLAEGDWNHLSSKIFNDTGTPSYICSAKPELVNNATVITRLERLERFMDLLHVGWKLVERKSKLG